jgi:magnesium transporter
VAADGVALAAVIVECAVYEDGRRRPGNAELRDAVGAVREPGAFAWIDLREPTAAELGSLADEFGLHPLAVEDAVVAHERPKLERYGDVAFLVLRTACYDDGAEEVRFGEVMLFAGERFVITVAHGEGADVAAVRRRVDRAPGGLPGGPADAVHAVLDAVVDGYEPVIRGLQGDIDEVEEALFAEGPGHPTLRIYKLGREVLELSRAVRPLVEPAHALAEATPLPGAGDEVRAYFRDVRDHVVRYDQWVGAQRELLSALLEANLTQVTIAQNEDMRRISAWVAIAVVPTIVGGVYGMNFEHMPELGWPFGYPLVMGVTLAICLALYLRLRRAGWL